MEKIKLGIIGMGNMGTTHANNIKNGKNPDIQFVAAADANPERLEKTKRDFGEEVALFENWKELMNSGLVDTVLICTPHYDHPKVAINGLQRGLHVMIEKPAGVYTKQVMEMNQAAETAKGVFGIMYNQRTNHIFRKMRELVQGGTLGAIKRTNWIITDWYRPAAYYRSGTWRATWKGEGGGVLLNQCPHNLDLWQWICGMPKTIQAHMHFGKWHDIEVEDDVTAYVTYQNGATGVFITTTGDSPGTNRFEITLEKGKLVAENGQLKLWELAQSEPEFSRTNTKPFASPEVTERIVETDGKNEQHWGVMNAFAGAILRNEPLIADGSEGINGLTISNAMHLSAWQNKEITLPIDHDLFYAELRKKW